MDKIHVETLPLGFCSTCLEQLANGSKPMSRRELGDGSILLSGFCSERSVGALIHLAPGKPQRWRLITPIDALEWPQFVTTHCGTRELLIQNRKTPLTSAETGL